PERGAAARQGHRRGALGRRPAVGPQAVGVPVPAWRSPARHPRGGRREPAGDPGGGRKQGGRDLSRPEGCPVGRGGVPGLRRGGRCRLQPHAAHLRSRGAPGASAGQHQAPCLRACGEAM
ncbi:unnamed protein product, partial [Prorocentrum cordatum]